MRSNRYIGAAILLGSLGAVTAGGCDLVAGIGTYCTEGVDPGCGTGGGTTNTAGGGGAGTTTTDAGGTGGTGTNGGGGVGGGECSSGATQECYGGTDETKNVGLCKAGTQTCQSDGTWGVCAGEQLPKPEDCSAPGDEDCNFGVGCSETVWGKIFGDTSEQTVQDVALDPQGNLYAVGDFQGTLELGGDPLIAGGSYDVFVAKFDPMGNHVWSRAFGNASGQFAKGVAVDSGGNVIVVGNFGGTMNIDGEVLTNEAEEDLFVFKLDPTGKGVWARRFGDPDSETYQYPRDVVVDKDDNVVFVGGFSGTLLDFDGEALTGGEVFMAKFSSDGAVLWATSFGEAAQSAVPTRVAADPAGNIAVVGTFSGVINFVGVATLTSTNTDGFVVRFDSDGECSWARRIDSAGSAISMGGIAVDAAGDVIVGAQTDSSTDAGGEVIEATSKDGLLVKYSSGGAFQWQRLLGGRGIESPPLLAVDSSKRISLTISTDGPLDLGTGELPVSGSFDLVLSTLAPDGGALWAKRYGAAGSFGAYGTVVGPKGQVGLGINGTGTIDFGSGVLTTKGYDVALAVIAPE